ncbi:MAG: HAMP domain-containing protein [Magnetococcales bacterium]|nr:HAMP domain-containing protein [Magnetococcales bacterium]
MRPLFSISLAGRTLVILLVGLTFSHILSILVFTSEKLEPAVLTNEEELLARMAVITRLLLETPASLHETVLSAINRHDLHGRLIPASGPHFNPPPEQNDEHLRQRLETLLHAPLAHVAAVNATLPDWNHHHGSFHRFLFHLEMDIIRLMHDTVMERELHAWIDLPGENRLLLETRLAANHVPLFRHATLSVIIMTGATLVFALIIAGYMTQPLKRIVAAADTIGQDRSIVQLPENGPSEVVAVARAFNRMNRRIREFVEERLRMIAAISHDLRTPLTKLKLLAEFVDDETTRKQMIATLDEMAFMLSSTLTFARDSMSSEAKQPVNMNSLLSAICADMVDAGHQVVFVEADKQTCSCRPLTMKRALTNLIHNAVQYGGAAQVSLQDSGKKLVVAIRDPGPGIPKEEWDHVFKPFFRLEPSRSPDTGGVGLGLAIADAVIRDHQGAIRFSYPEGGGFMARVELKKL